MKYIKEFLEEKFGFIATGEIELHEDDCGFVYISVKGKMKDTISVAWSDYATYLESKIEQLTI